MFSPLPQLSIFDILAMFTILVCYLGLVFASLFMVRISFRRLRRDIKRLEEIL